MTTPRTTKEWLTAGTPPERRQRSLWVQVLVALTSTTALVGTVALVAAAAIVPPIGARRMARDAALGEVESAMAPGERIVAQAFASQRRWTDMWRESFGVVVATDRRLLYVGAPPHRCFGRATTGRWRCWWRAIPTTRRSHWSRGPSFAGAGAGSSCAPPVHAWTSSWMTPRA
ncbi:MAG: hypothetical protein ACK5HM_09380, partial [Gemmatimonas sp.]|uniref:hypothetical protein n=1 Tax=Gemmatimonas sp. TaxID=1962908 RepID=UPI00391A3BB7